MTVFTAQLEKESQVACPRVRSLAIGFSSLVLLFFPLALHFFLMMGFIGLTVIFLLGYFFVDKRHVAPSLNLVNIADLNRVLRSKVFVSEDR